MSNACVTDVAFFPKLLVSTTVSFRKTKKGYEPFGDEDYFQCFQELSLLFNQRTVTSCGNRGLLSTESRWQVNLESEGQTEIRRLHEKVNSKSFLKELDAFRSTVLSVNYLFTRGEGNRILAGSGLVIFRKEPGRCWITFLATIGGSMAGGHPTIVLLALFARAKELGFNEIFVWTTSDNELAIKFYNGLGFEEIRERAPDAPEEKYPNVKTFRRSTNTLFWPWRMLISDGLVYAPVDRSLVEKD